ncbi:MAG: PorP/SprF family type IX secretion system membrane protein [Chitinophagales bacterium]|nr:PorP/SprF family type IX secretion system membrane protein [Chitinophagales bacterium]
MKYFKLFLISFLLITEIVEAQDPHFSQFYYSPLTENPALTGAFDGSYRLGTIYKNQWGSVTSPFVYSTPSISGDYKLMNNGYNNNYLGVGLMLLNDRSGDANLSNLTAMFSAAYHLSLDQRGYNHISIGLQGGIVQKSIDQAALKFLDQYDGNGGFTGISAEHFDNVSILYPDFSAGAAYTSVISKQTRFQAGISVFHLTQPTERFLQSTVSNDRLPIRYLAHASATFGLNSKIYLFPFGQFQMQNKNQEVVAGANIGYKFAGTPSAVGTLFYVGAFTRVKYNVVPTVGFMMNGLQFGLSYDVNLSNDLKAVAKSNGGFELALVYTGILRSDKGQPIPCPTF